METLFVNLLAVTVGLWALGSAALVSAQPHRRPRRAR